MAEAPRRIEIPLTVEHDGETVEIGRLCYVREDVAERENAELRELVRRMFYAVHPLDRAQFLVNVAEMGIEVDG